MCFSHLAQALEDSITNAVVKQKYSRDFLLVLFFKTQIKHYAKLLLFPKSNQLKQIDGVMDKKSLH